MFYIEHAGNSPASVLINCLKHRYLMGYYGTTFVVCCSRLCFGFHTRVKSSASAFLVWSLMFRGECSSSFYLRMFDGTKDASGHAQMLLFRPGFLSFQKTPLHLTKCSFFFLCVCAISQLSRFIKQPNLSMIFH